MLQTTIESPIECSGIGLHSGKKVKMALRPAPEDAGVMFCLLGKDGKKMLRPCPEAVRSTQLATTLCAGGDSVATVEHLMAALRGMGVDNVRVDLDGCEVPIMDGSAASFVYLLRMAGIKELSAPRRVLALTKPIEFVREGKYIKATPYNGFKVDFTIDFPHPLIGKQSMSFNLTGDRFAEKLAKARTFGFLKEVEYLHQNGLALGGSLENAVVLDEFGVLNEDGLRFDDEFVRHKVLDFIGDMAVSEYPLFAHFDVFASGHALNNEFLRYLTENADEYLEEVTLGRPVPRHSRAGVAVAQPQVAAAMG
ncbi:MAG: UDP-3-O-acyl-N-acetylglucosamine deacetylase [Desulfovibrio sp.]|uniref:UDP-3-O-acyl-N-acetylglucosamine deacetylase n=1 Tax=Desulfovibrio sp. 7SRBS1 TaxID=3378064 RepID=UPI003B3C4396